MFGGSAYGVACWTAAVQRPPHLKALFLTTGAPTDAYRDQWYIGGVYQLQNRVGWTHMMMPRLGLPELPPPDAPGAEMRRRVYHERLAEMQRRAQAGKGLLNLDWFDETLQHPTDGPYWRGKSTYPQLGNVDVPAYLLDNWDHHFSTGTIRAYHSIATPKKLTLFPRNMTPPPWGMASGEPPIDFEALMVEWFDYWLKEIDNGVMDQPPVLLYVQGEDAWREEREWPLARTEYQRFYLHAGPSGSAGSLNDGLLDTTMPAVADAGTTYLHDPDDPVLTPPHPADRRPAEARALTFSTAPLGRDLEATGPITVQLYARSSAGDTDFIVHLTDVAPDGTSRYLNFGALKASHHRSHETPSALTPGEAYCFPIEIWPTSNVFKAGHRLRLSVASSDFPTFAVSPLRAENRILHDATHPSHVVLPVIPR